MVYVHALGASICAEGWAGSLSIELTSRIGTSVQVGSKDYRPQLVTQRYARILIQSPMLMAKKPGLPQPEGFAATVDKRPS